MPNGEVLDLFQVQDYRKTLKPLRRQEISFASPWCGEKFIYLQSAQAPITIITANGVEFGPLDQGDVLELPALTKFWVKSTLAANDNEILLWVGNGRFRPMFQGQRDASQSSSVVLSVQDRDALAYPQAQQILAFPSQVYPLYPALLTTDPILAGKYRGIRVNLGVNQDSLNAGEVGIQIYGVHPGGGIYPVARFDPGISAVGANQNAQILLYPGIPENTVPAPTGPDPNVFQNFYSKALPSSLRLQVVPFHGCNQGEISLWYELLP